MQDGPGEGAGQAHADQTRQAADQGKFHGKGRHDNPSRPADRLENGRLIQATVPCRRDGRGHDDRAAHHAQERNPLNGPGQLFQQPRHVRQHVADLDRRHVGKGSNERVLERQFFFGFDLRRGNVGHRGSVQRARGKNHEKVHGKTSPVNLPRTLDDSGHGRPLNGELDRGPQVHAKVDRSLILNRHANGNVLILLISFPHLFRIGRPPCPFHYDVIPGKQRESRERVLPGEVPSVPFTFVLFGINHVPVKRLQPRPNHGSEPVWSMGGFPLQDLFKRLPLIRLNVDEEKRRGILWNAFSKGDEQRRFHQRDRDNDHDADPDRHGHAPRVVARALHVAQRLPDHE